QTKALSQHPSPHFPTRLVLSNSPLQPQHMPRITPPRLRNKMTRKIIKIIVLLKTHTTTRTLRQSISTSITGSPSATGHEASDNQPLPDFSREYPQASSSPHQPSSLERHQPSLRYAQSPRDTKRNSCPYRSLVHAL